MIFCSHKQVDDDCPCCGKDQCGQKHDVKTADIDQTAAGIASDGGSEGKGSGNDGLPLCHIRRRDPHFGIVKQRWIDESIGDGLYKFNGIYMPDLYGEDQQKRFYGIEDTGQPHQRQDADFFLHFFKEKLNGRCCNAGNKEGNADMAAVAAHAPEYGDQIILTHKMAHGNQDHAGDCNCKIFVSDKKCCQGNGVIPGLCFYCHAAISELRVTEYDDHIKGQADNGDPYHPVRTKKRHHVSEDQGAERVSQRTDSEPDAIVDRIGMFPIVCTQRGIH